LISFFKAILNGSPFCLFDGLIKLAYFSVSSS